MQFLGCEVWVLCSTGFILMIHDYTNSFHDFLGFPWYFQLSINWCFHIVWQSPLNCYISILLILPIVLFFYLRRWAWSPHCKNRFYIVNIISLMYLTINPRRSNVYIFYFIHPIINNRTRVIAWNIILLILLKKISPNLRTNQNSVSLILL